MGDDILTNLGLQSADLFVRVSRVGPLAPGVASQVCGPEPLRMLLMVVQDDAVTTISVSPARQAASGPLATTDLKPHVLIHASVYPGLIRLPWYVVADAGDTVTVYEVLRIA